MSNEKQNMSTEETMRRDAIARQFSALLYKGSLDEVSVLFDIGARVLGGGLDNYGHLDIATDARDFEAELDDELRDAVFYIAIERLRRRARRVEAMRMAAAVEIANLTSAVKRQAYRDWLIFNSREDLGDEVARLDGEIREGFQRERD